MVHELTKTIRIFFDREMLIDNSSTNVEVSIQNKEEILIFLNSSSHSA